MRGSSQRLNDRYSTTEYFIPILTYLLPKVTNILQVKRFKIIRSSTLRKWEIDRTKVIRYRFMHGSSQRLNDRYNTTEYFTCRNALFCCWGSVVGLALDLVTSRPLCCRRRLTKAAKPTSPAISSRPIVEMTTAVDSDWLKPASILSLYP